MMPLSLSSRDLQIDELSVLVEANRSLVLVVHAEDDQRVDAARQRPLGGGCQEVVEDLVGIFVVPVRVLRFSLEVFVDADEGG